VLVVPLSLGAGVLKPLALPGPEVPMPEPLVMSVLLPVDPVVATPEEPLAPVDDPPPDPPADCAIAPPPRANRPIAAATAVILMVDLQF